MHCCVLWIGHELEKPSPLDRPYCHHAHVLSFFALVFRKSKYRMKMSADLLKIMDGREPWITCECSGAADLLFQSTQTQIKGSDFGVDDHRCQDGFKNNMKCS
jgi:predicted nucleic acid-binding Zn ribbon protein